jgi:hypothetical protein
LAYNSSHQTGALFSLKLPSIIRWLDFRANRTLITGGETF